MQAEHRPELELTPNSSYFILQASNSRYIIGINWLTKAGTDVQTDKGIYIP